MNKGVFLCVGTGGHVLPAYNVIKSMLDQGIDKKNILIVTDERGIEYFKEKEFKLGRLLLFLASVTIFIAIASYVLDKFFLVY